MSCWTLFTLVLPREFISFSTDNVHRLIKPLAFFKETFRFGDYSNVRWRHVSYLSDFRQLFELEMLTSCYDTGYDVGFRNRPDAFVSSFAPPGTGYAEISFELRSVLYSVCFLCAYAHGGGAKQRSQSFDNISRGNSFSRSIMLYCIVACRGALTRTF